MASVYKRGSTYWVRFQWRGQEIRKSARTTVKGEAREYLATLQEQYRRIDRGGNPRVPFSEAAATYIDEYLSHLEVSTIRSYQQSLRVLNEEFGTMYLDEISRSKIARFEAAQLRRVSPSKVKHYRAALSGVFKVALRHEWIEQNPCRSLDAIKVSNARERFLTPKEWKSLRDALPEPLRSIAEMSVARGLRCGEVLNLEWRDVDENMDTLTIREAKGNKRRVIPLEGARAILDRQPRNGRLVFPTRTGNRHRVDNTTKRVNAIAREAGVDDFTFHDLRHTFASWYVQRGGDMYKLQLILGHEGPAMTQRYAHLRVDDLRETRTKTGTVH
jgi:integrase/recombinase XerD